jgi:hypothetical protein
MLTNEDKDCIKELAKEACCGSGEICQEFAQDAETAKNLAQQSAAQATIDAMTASVAASNALTSEQNALTSEQNALTSEQNAATSEQNALTSEQNALTSEQNALTSEQNALTSEQNAFTSEQNAQLAETNAVNAAATINSQVDFTGAANGDILLHNGTIFEPVEHREALRSKVPFERSPVVDLQMSRLYAWDNLDRPNVANLTGTLTDSGHTYVNILGSDFNLNNNAIRPLGAVNTDNITAINTGFGSVAIEGYLGGMSFGNRIGYVIGKDDQNYFKAVMSGADVTISKVIGGVETVILSQFVFDPASSAFQNIPLKCEFRYYHKQRSDASAIHFIINGVGRVSGDTQFRGFPTFRFFDVTADNATFDTNSDVAFAGIIGNGNRFAYNWKIYNIEQLI